MHMYILNSSAGELNSSNTLSPPLSDENIVCTKCHVLVSYNAVALHQIKCFNYFFDSFRFIIGEESSWFSRWENSYFESLKCKL